MVCKFGNHKIEFIFSQNGKYAYWEVENMSERPLAELSLANVGYFMRVDDGDVYRSLVEASTIEDELNYFSLNYNSDPDKYEQEFLDFLNGEYVRLEP